MGASFIISDCQKQYFAEHESNTHPFVHITFPHICPFCYPGTSPHFWFCVVWFPPHQVFSWFFSLVPFSYPPPPFLLPTRTHSFSVLPQITLTALSVNSSIASYVHGSVASCDTAPQHTVNTPLAEVASEEAIWTHTHTEHRAGICFLLLWCHTYVAIAACTIPYSPPRKAALGAVSYCEEGGETDKLLCECADPNVWLSSALNNS